ncbi:unnamed protein product [Citrullus colocynthis]|uniref:Uncharacterized protein n=1 Tax=Citrullus colocynthis TaxID=252529 RepID=A0ABP0YQ65_9ROSI
MGKKEIVSFLSILLLLVASSKGLNEFDYYQVIFQWQPGVCSSSTLKSPFVKPPQNKYTIHGVWPSLTSGNATKCSGTPPYDGTKINAIRSRLDQDWPSVVYGTNPTLWSHEWKTHGTCSNYYLNQYNYFNFGLSVFGKYNMISILRKYGTNPNGNEYSIDYIENAIYNATVKMASPSLQ